MDLGFQKARVVWKESDTPIDDIEVALSEGWVHLRDQRGKVVSYPGDRVAQVEWKKDPSKPEALEGDLMA